MAKQKDKAADGMIKARVLVDGAAGSCNTVVEAEAAQIEIWQASGLVDPSPEAVAAVEGESAAPAE